MVLWFCLEFPIRNYLWILDTSASTIIRLNMHTRYCWVRLTPGLQDDDDDVSTYRSLAGFTFVLYVMWKLDLHCLYLIAYERYIVGVQPENKINHGLIKHSKNATATPPKSSLGHFRKLKGIGTDVMTIYLICKKWTRFLIGRYTKTSWRRERERMSTRYFSLI